MIQLRTVSPSRALIEKAIHHPLPPQLVKHIGDLGDEELAKAALEDVPNYESRLGVHGQSWKNESLRARQEARVLARMKLEHARELCRVMGLDPDDLEDRVFIDGAEVKASEVEKAGPVSALLPMDAKDRLLELLDDVGTFFGHVDSVDREDREWVTSPQVKAIASMVDMLRGSWRRACEATGRGP